MKKMKFISIFTFTIAFVTMSFTTLAACSEKKDSSMNFSGGNATNTNVALVASVTELQSKLSCNVIPDTICIKNGTYDTFVVTIAQSGKSRNPLVIMAEEPGKVIFKGATEFKLLGNYIELNGFYFSEAVAGGLRQPIVNITGDHNRVTQCAFHACHHRVAVSSVYQSATDKMPQYTHIDHCYFADNLGFGLYLDLGKTPPSTDEKYTMYYRVNNCYFSTPFKMGANTGSSMRIGLGDQSAYGRCLVDNNLFERQNGEDELIEGKSTENLYINNTFLNCESNMSFRQGHRTVFLHNQLIGTDAKRPTGGLSMWMDDAIIAGNYFSFPHGSYVSLRTNMTQRDDRKPAAVVHFNCGYKNFVRTNGKFATHLAAQNNTFVNNTFDRCKDYLFNAIYIQYQMVNWGTESTVPYNNLIKDNDVISGEFENTNYIYKDQNFETKNNKIENLRFVNASSSPLNIPVDKINYPLLSSMQAWLGQLPGDNKNYDLNALANSKAGTYSLYKNAVKVNLSTKPLSFKDVGPDWLTENPSTFAQNGEYTPELIATIREKVGL